MQPTAGCSPHEPGSDGQGEYETQLTKAKCAQLTTCDAATPCKDVKHTHRTCVALASCSKAACIDPKVACEMECGAKGCSGTLMSYPGQLLCNGGGGSTPPGSTPGGGGN